MDNWTRLQIQVEHLSTIAKIKKWPIYEDHCLYRVLYDHVFKTDWRTQVPSPCYKHLTDEQYELIFKTIYKITFRGNIFIH